MNRIYNVTDQLPDADVFVVGTPLQPEQLQSQVVAAGEGAKADEGASTLDTIAEESPFSQRRSTIPWVGDGSVGVK